MRDATPSPDAKGMKALTIFGNKRLEVSYGHCSMPEKSKKPRHSPRSNLTPYGRWLYDLCDYLGVDLSDVAERSGMPISTLSKGARNERIPRRETIEQLERTLQDIAREKGYPWTASELEQPLYNSAGHATQGQIRKADQARRDIISEMVRKRDTLDSGEK